MEEIRHHKSQECPKYSSMMVIFFLLLRYSSCQTYKLFLEQLPLPSLSLLKKVSSGNVDSLKFAKLLV